ncbi:MAG: holo-[acyl-carrier protein] synthase [Desulfonauticus sp.]|jgi:holo-[acyl-carrier protein] synthase|nr:MAG: Holo-[acyl-carrier-protein] synthase [Desulfonauticus sp. 38_4375]MDK2920602.1 holo-[acyl-carrier protein] synthase [Desulfonauticus sp.]
MVLGVGLDLVELERIKKIYQRYGNRFAQKILGTKELAHFQEKKNKIEFLASRFAVKEATVKALGTGFTQGINFKDIETLNTPQGKPYLSLSGEAKIWFQKLGAKHSWLSLTHNTLVAGAVVILEG